MIMKVARLEFHVPIYGGVEIVEMKKTHESASVLRAFLDYQKSIMPSDAVVKSCVIACASL